MGHQAPPHLLNVKMKSDDWWNLSYSKPAYIHIYLDIKLCMLTWPWYMYTGNRGVYQYIKSQNTREIKINNDAGISDYLWLKEPCNAINRYRPKHVTMPFVDSASIMMIWVQLPWTVLVDNRQQWFPLWSILASSQLTKLINMGFFTTTQWATMLYHYISTCCCRRLAEHPCRSAERLGGVAEDDLCVQMTSKQQQKRQAGCAVPCK